MRWFSDQHTTANGRYDGPKLPPFFEPLTRKTYAFLAPSETDTAATSRNFAIVHTTVTDGIHIAAPAGRIWEVLLDRGQARIWRGADFETDWKKGSPIRISSRIGSKNYRDRGTVILANRPSILIYDFLPKVSGLPDVAESYSRVTFQLTEVEMGTSLQVEHTVPPSPVRRGNGFEIGPESGEKHVRFYWRSTLPLLRDLVEGRDTIALKLATAASADYA